MLFSVGCDNKFLFLDAGLLTCEFSEVEDACSANFTNLVDFDVLDER